MASSSLTGSIQIAVQVNNLYCSICCEVFKEPKLLPNCGHSFCKDCLQAVSECGVVVCPLCRKTSSTGNDGVEGLPPNRLLVELIDELPGQKEKELIGKALRRCKEELEKNKRIQDLLEKKLSQIKDNKQQASKLKEEISEHAQKAVDSIRKWEQDCHKEIDSQLSRNCYGLDFYKRLNEQRNKIRKHINEAVAYVQKSEEMLKRDRTSEIIDMKDAVLARLDEYCTVPQCTTILQEAENVECFTMKFQKNEPQLNRGKLHSNESVLLPSSGSCSSDINLINVPSLGRNDTAIIEDQIPLEFEPFCISVCPRSGHVALLWKERREVHLYDKDLDCIRKIFIKYGDLWDVGFTIGNEVVLVNRANNRLILYKKNNGNFVHDFEVETPRKNVKFTYVYIDAEGRFIVTSTKVDDDEEISGIVPCIIVYEKADEKSKNMSEPLIVGRRHLQKPISRAVFLDGKFYVADECNGKTELKVFTSQGQHISLMKIPTWFCSISTMQPSLVALHIKSTGKSDMKLVFLENDIKTGTTEVQRCLFPGLKQAVVLSGDPCVPVKQLEIYKDMKCFCKVEYRK